MGPARGNIGRLPGRLVHAPRRMRAARETGTVRYWPAYTTARNCAAISAENASKAKKLTILVLRHPGWNTGRLAPAAAYQSGRDPEWFIGILRGRGGGLRPANCHDGVVSRTPRTED